VLCLVVVMCDVLRYVELVERFLVEGRGLLMEILFRLVRGCIGLLRRLLRLS
jgi:hypothetical protein